MARKRIIGALPLVGVGVVLGTTVFRDDIAQATGLAPAPSSVVVVNSSAQPVPMDEQNLDSGGSIKVGVNPTSYVTKGGGVFVCTAPSSCPVGHFVVATWLHVGMTSGVTSGDFSTGNPPTATAMIFLGPQQYGPSTFTTALTYPIGFDTINCFGDVGDKCYVSWSGAAH